MKIPDLVKKTCLDLLDVLSKTPDIDLEIKQSLAQKIGEIFARAADLDEWPQLVNDLTLSDFAGQKKDEVPLATRILKRIGSDVPLDIQSKMIRELFESHHPRTRFPESPGYKEGRAKEYAAATMRAQEEKVPLTFDRAAGDRLDLTEMVDTFRAELNERYSAIHGRVSPGGKRAIDFLSYLFQEALQECTDEVSFRSLFEKKIREKIIYREMVDRDVFEEFLKGPVNREDPNIAPLFKQYIDGSWKDGEEQELIIQEISDKEMPKFRTILDDVLDSHSFEETLEVYLRFREVSE